MSGMSLPSVHPTAAPVLKLNILVVDDSLPILKMSSMMLRKQGHTIATAENGAEALQLMSAQKMTSVNVILKPNSEDTQSPTHVLR